MPFLLSLTSLALFTANPGTRPQLEWAKVSAAALKAALLAFHGEPVEYMGVFRSVRPPILSVTSSWTAVNTVQVSYLSVVCPHPVIVWGSGDTLPVSFVVHTARAFLVLLPIFHGGIRKDLKLMP